MKDNNDFNLDDILKTPEYEVKAKRFLSETPWRLNNSLRIDEGDTSVMIRMTGSDDRMFTEAKDNFIKEIEASADETGFVSVSQVERARSGDEQIDNAVGWDLNELKRNREEHDIFTAHNYAVHGSINFEEKGILEPIYYNLGNAIRAFREICEDAIASCGKLKDEIKACAYRRHNGTVCIQIFFSFIFNDEIESPSFDLDLANLRMIELINQVSRYTDGYQQYSVSLKSES